MGSMCSFMQSHQGGEAPPPLLRRGSFVQNRQGYMELSSSPREDCSGSTAPTRNNTRSSARTCCAASSSVEVPDKATGSSANSLFSGQQTNSHVDSASSYFWHQWETAPCINHLHDRGMGTCVLDPNSKIMILRDVLMSSCVMWSILVAPLELSIVSNATCPFLLFVDLAIDVFLFLDIPLHFGLAFEKNDQRGIHHVFDRVAIAKKYIHGWLLVDIICACPVELVQFMPIRGWKFQMFAQILQMVRLIRVVKIERGNYIKRLDLPFAQLKGIKMAMSATLVAHIFACIWASLIEFSPDKGNWVEALTQSKLGFDDDSSFRNPFILYGWSIYFAFSLITTVGFGDVTPQNAIEGTVVFFGILLGSIIWAFIISSLLEILSRMDPHRAAFEIILDELNQLTSSRGLPDQLRHDVRTYFFECEALWKCQAQQHVIQRMSPSMQGRVSLTLCSVWIENIPYFQGILQKGHALPSSTEFFVEIAGALEQRIYPKGESLTDVALYIIQKGTVTNGAKILIPGDVFGEDIILSNPENRRPLAPCAITTVSTLQMVRTPLVDILSRFPEQEAVVRRHVVRLAMRRGMVRELKRLARRSSVSPPSLLRSKTEDMRSMEAMMEEFLEKGNSLMDQMHEIRESVGKVEVTQQKLVQQVGTNNHGLRAIWDRIQSLEASP